MINQTTLKVVRHELYLFIFHYGNNNNCDSVDSSTRDHESSTRATTLWLRYQLFLGEEDTDAID